MLAGISQLFFHRYFHCRLYIDGDFAQQTHQLIVANGRYFGETVLVEDATITNQQLVLYLMTPLEPWQLAGVWLGDFSPSASADARPAALHRP